MKPILSAVLCLLAATPCLAQPEQVWVARYNGGYTAQNHTPVGMALDPAGDIVIAGSSQNASGRSDYVVLKYCSGGEQLWATRFSSTNALSFTNKDFALDTSGNAYITGTGGTVKFDTTGAVAWSADYAGNGLAVDTSGNVYVTGFSNTAYATVKLDARGTNVWLRTFVESCLQVQRTESQKVAVGPQGEVYVAGWETWGCYPTPYTRPSIIKYDAAGNPLWTNLYAGGLEWGQTEGLIIDGQGGAYVTGNAEAGYQTARISADGTSVWSFESGGPGVSAMATGASGNVFLTGQRKIYRPGGYYVGSAYGTFKLSASGSRLWEADYFGQGPGNESYNAATALTVDGGGNTYVTGTSTNTSTANDWATIKYDPAGNQLWLLRYSGSANGNDGGSGIAVAPDGSIYVSGYSGNSSGGMDIVLIKYAYRSGIQKRGDGSVQLQLLGNPSQPYSVQASTNLVNWTDIGSATADIEGLLRFTDNNAPLFQCRFYRQSPP